MGKAAWFTVFAMISIAFFLISNYTDDAPDPRAADHTSGKATEDAKKEMPEPREEAPAEDPQTRGISAIPVCERGCTINGSCAIECLGEKGCKATDVSPIEAGRRKISSLELCNGSSAGSLVTLETPVCEGDRFIEKVFCRSCTRAEPVVLQCETECLFTRCRRDRTLFPRCDIDEVLKCVSYSIEDSIVFFEIQNTGQKNVSIDRFEIEETDCGFPQKLLIEPGEIAGFGIGSCDIPDSNVIKSNLLVTYTDYPTRDRYDASGWLEVKAQG